MKLYRQTDSRWAGDIMTGVGDAPNMSSKEKLKRWGHNKVDTVSRYFCLGNTLSNIDLLRGGSLNPGKFNQLLRDNKGYYFLEQGSSCKIQQESFIRWEVALWLIGAKGTNRNLGISDIAIEDPERYYIAKVPYDPPQLLSGHYNLITGVANGITHFDSDTGVYRKDWGQSPYYEIIEVIF